MNSTSRDSATLRRTAEEALRQAGSPTARPDVDPAVILYELEVHRVELEMQNEALRDLQADVDASRARYRAAFDASPGPCVIAAENGLILEANRAAGALFGIEPAKLRGAPLSRFVAADHAEAFELHRRRVVSDKGRAASEIIVARGDGHPQSARLESVRLDPGSREWLTAFVGVTDLPRPREEPSDLRDPDWVARLVEVTRNFNNLLHSIIAASHLALLDSTNVRKARRRIEMIRQTAWHGRSIVRGLDRGSVESSVTDLNEFAAAILTKLVGIARAESVIHLNFRATDARVRVDRSVIEQILVNLVGDALRATPGGQALRVSTSNFDTPSRDGAGPGPRFVRLSVAEMAGESREGSRERAFDFPVVPDRHLPDELPPALALPPLGLRVLIAETDPLARRAQTAYLEELECDCVVVATGEAAIDAIRDNVGKFHVLLLDARSLDAAEDLARLAAEADPRITVILTSANPVELIPTPGSADEKTCILQKPFTADTLLWAIRNARRSLDTIPPPRALS